jgi:hypothetical protein
MKKLFTLMLVASLGLFALGCNGTTETIDPAPPAADTGMPGDPATTDPAATDPTTDPGADSLTPIEPAPEPVEPTDTP